MTVEAFLEKPLILSSCLTASMRVVGGRLLLDVLGCCIIVLGDSLLVEVVLENLPASGEDLHTTLPVATLELPCHPEVLGNEKPV